MKKCLKYAQARAEVPMSDDTGRPRYAVSCGHAV